MARPCRTQGAPLLSKAEFDTRMTSALTPPPLTQKPAGRAACPALTKPTQWFCRVLACHGLHRYLRAAAGDNPRAPSWRKSWRFSVPILAIAVFVTMWANLPDVQTSLVRYPGRCQVLGNRSRVAPRCHPRRRTRGPRFYDAKTRAMPSDCQW